MPGIRREEHETHDAPWGVDDGVRKDNALMIHCQEISLRFPGKTIFERFSCRIRAGERVGLAGASGEGKSTLLRIFAGLVIPDSGDLWIQNKKMSPGTVRKIREAILRVPQNIHLPVEKAADLKPFLRPAARIQDDESERTVRETTASYLRHLGLDESFPERDFSQISDGQKQRLILALSLGILSSPGCRKEIILLDEPGSALDDAAEASLISLIKTAPALRGKTLVAASHRPQWLQSCDRVIKL